MGYSFSALLIKHDGDPRGLRDRMKEHYRSKGYVQARGADEADVTIRLYADAKHGWAVAAGELPEEEELVRFSKAMNTPIIRADNFDSDALLLTLTDSTGSESVGCGDMEVMQLAHEETPMWDALMKTEDARARLEEILQTERVFIEEALTELAPLIGFRADILDIPMDEDDGEGPKPFCVIRMKEKSGQSGFLADQDAPPSLACYIEFADRIHLTMCPTGGEGKGIVVTVVACGFEPEAYRIKEEELSTRKSVGLDVEKCVHPAEIKEYTAPDGRRGWQLNYPSVEIARGIKSDLRGRLSNKEYSYILETHISLDINMVGMRYDSPGFAEWMQEKMDARKNGTPFVWQVSIYPAENPAGGIELRKVL